VRVIDEKGKQVGVVDIKKALGLAQKANLDLVEIAPNAKPPVTKIVDLGKFKYDQEKKAKKQKKQTKAADLKEVRFTPFIASHDFDTRIERVKEFLAEKHKVRITVRFKGRQMNSKKFGYDLTNKVLNIFKDKVTVDMQPKFVGRNLIMVISPTGKGTSNAKAKNS
jgi:translation initiation factor IF-3